MYIRVHCRQGVLHLNLFTHSEKTHELLHLPAGGLKSRWHARLLGPFLLSLIRAEVC